MSTCQHPRTQLSKTVNKLSKQSSLQASGRRRQQPRRASIVHVKVQQMPPPRLTQTRQDKTRQDKTRQDKTRQDKTRQDKTRQDKTRQDTTRHDTTRHDTTRHDTTRHDTTAILLASSGMEASAETDISQTQVRLRQEPRDTATSGRT